MSSRFTWLVDKPDDEAVLSAIENTATRAARAYDLEADQFWICTKPTYLDDEDDPHMIVIFRSPRLRRLRGWRPVYAYMRSETDYSLTGMRLVNAKDVLNEEWYVPFLRSLHTGN